jgi:hypothetical protein
MFSRHRFTIKFLHNDAQLTHTPAVYPAITTDAVVNCRYTACPRIQVLWPPCLNTAQRKLAHQAYPSTIMYHSSALDAVIPVARLDLWRTEGLYIIRSLVRGRNITRPD